MGGKAKDPRERKGTDGCVVLLGKSHRGRPEAGETLTMISHGVEISIAGGGADEKDALTTRADPFVYNKSGNEGQSTEEETIANAYEVSRKLPPIAPHW